MAQKTTKAKPKQKEEVIEMWVHGTQWNQDSNTLYRQIPCSECGQWTFVGASTLSIVCSDCVREKVEAPNLKPSWKASSSGRPRGWKFMKEFVDKDGTVYHRGVEQPKLKGTLEPTKVEKKETVKLSKAQKSDIIARASRTVGKLKRALAKAKYKKDKTRIERDIRKLSKLINAKRIPVDYEKYFPKN